MYFIIILELYSLYYPTNAILSILPFSWYTKEYTYRI